MLNLKIVVDTNVLVSAAMKEASIPGVIVNMALKRAEFTVVYSDEIFKEYLDVLNRKKLNLPVMSVNSFISLILKFGEKTSPFPQYAYFRDESDKKFYEAFKTTNADYLITGNLDDFPQEKGIVSPKRFAEILNIRI
jgi:putative PIN family toxin of toxin-antitoxin system